MAYSKVKPTEMNAGFFILRTHKATESQSRKLIRSLKSTCSKSKTKLELRFCKRCCQPGQRKVFYPNAKIGAYCIECMRSLMRIHKTPKRKVKSKYRMQCHNCTNTIFTYNGLCVTCGTPYDTVKVMNCQCQIVPPNSGIKGSHHEPDCLMYQSNSIDVLPNWSIVGTAHYIENELKDFKFKGSGLYATETDTLLIVPRWPDDNPWRADFSADTLFNVYCYNTPIKNTIFSHQNLPHRA
jgi:hypothetical protein